jgi:hypothetical protein
MLERTKRVSNIAAVLFLRYCSADNGRGEPPKGRLADTKFSDRAYRMALYRGIPYIYVIFLRYTPLPSEDTNIKISTSLHDRFPSLVPVTRCP